MEEDMYEGMYEEGYGDDNLLNKLSPEDREDKLKTQPVYSEEEDKDADDVITYKGKHINRLFPSGMFVYYSDSEERFIKSDDLDYVKYMVDKDNDDFIDSVPFPPHEY